MYRLSLHGRIFVAFASVLMALSACGQAAPTASSPPVATTNVPVVVRLAYFPNVTHAVGLVGVQRGTLQTALGTNTLDVKSFNAGPALIEAMFAGEIDIGYVGPNPAINGYVKSQGQALRVIAGASSAGALFIVRPEANIRAASDLAGKKFATPQLGGTQDVALRYYLQQNGLKPADKGGDVTIVPTQNPDILTLFKQGQIDGAWVPEPWATRLILEANGQVFIDERDIWPQGQFVTTHVVVSTKFFNEHPDLVAAFLKAHVETVQYVRANTEEAKQIVNSEITRITTRGLADEVIDTAWKTVDFTYDPLPETLFASADHAFDLGFLGTSKPDLRGMYALEPLNAILTAQGSPAIALP